MAGHADDQATAAAALADTDASVRIAALRSLARLGALADESLRVALDDEDHTVRIAALEVAAPRSTPPLAHLLTDPHPAVAETAAWACGERPDTGPAEVRQLSSLARTHDDPLVRESAVAALGAIGEPDGLSAILEATHDKPAVRRRAVVALAAFEGPEVDAAWARARNDRDRQVRDAVDELLGPIDEE